MNLCERCCLNKIVARGLCAKCYYYLKYKKEISNLDKPKINNFSEYQNQYLIGSMLGDGNLHRNKTSKFAHMKAERAYHDIDYLKFEYLIMKNFCKSDTKTYERQDGNGKNCYFITRSYEIIDELYQTWYKDKIKIIPNNISLSPFSIAIWLCDDGHIGIHHKKYGLVTLTFATNGFSKNEVEFLCDLLYKRYNEKFNISKTSNKKQFVITAGDRVTRILIDDIKHCFPISMSRKLSNLDLRYKLGLIK